MFREGDAGGTQLLREYRIINKINKTEPTQSTGHADSRTQEAAGRGVAGGHCGRLGGLCTPL